MILSALFKFVQSIVDLISFLVDKLYSFLPDSPFQVIQNSQFNDLIAKINFFIPIYEFLAIMQLWLLAIAVFYVYSLFARWLKAIE